MRQRESLVAESSINDTDYYNTIKDRYDELTDKLGNYDKLTDKVKSLQEDLNEAKEAKDKDEIKRLKAEIKETQKERKQYKLTNKEKNALKTTENQKKVLDSIGDTMVSIGATTTAAYQDLVKKIGNLEAKGEDNLTKKQQKNLQMFRDELTALNSGILANQVTDYIKVFEKWWKLDQKKVRTKQENLDYMALTEQKNAMREAYNASMKDLNDQLKDIQNSKTDTSDKIDEVTRSQTKETEETEKSYDTQINDLINSFSTNNAYAKWLKAQQENLASIQTQEQKKAKAIEDKANADQKITENQNIIKEADAIINDTKKTAADKKAAKKQKSAAQKALKAAQEAKKTAEKNQSAAEKKLETLKAQKKVYDDELKALEAGADSVNYAEYLEAYRYVRDAKAYFANTGKYKDKAKYDVYQNKLDAWNNAKDLQITTLQKARKDALEQIAKKYEQQLKDLNAELNSIDSNGWEILRKTFELQIEYYEQDAALAEALVTHYKTIADILSNTDLDTLKNFDVNGILEIKPDNPAYKEKSFIWNLLGLDDTKSAEDIISNAYYNAIDQAKKKLANSSILYDAYSELISAVETGNFDNVITDEFRASIKDEQALANLDLMLEKVNALRNPDNKETEEWKPDEWLADWQERQSQLVSNLQSDINTIQELKDALRENVYFKAINNAIEQLESFKNKYQAFANIIDNEWVRDESGITEFGYAKVQALTSELEAARKEMNLYAEMVQNVDEAWANGDTKYANEDEYIKARNDALSNYYNSLQNAYSIEQNIYQIGKQALEEEVDEVKKAVDAYKIALNSKKEYWDYSKNIQNKTKEIEALQAQIDALNGVSFCPFYFNCGNPLRVLITKYI